MFNIHLGKFLYSCSFIHAMDNSSVNFLNLKFKNPTILASGIMDMTASAMRLIVQNGAAGVVTKSIGLEPRQGHHSPIIITDNAFIINAVGLSNPGSKESIEEIIKFKKS